MPEERPKLLSVNEVLVRTFEIIKERNTKGKAITFSKPIHTNHPARGGLEFLTHANGIILQTNTGSWIVTLGVSDITKPRRHYIGGLLAFYKENLTTTNYEVENFIRIITDQTESVHFCLILGIASGMIVPGGRESEVYTPIKIFLDKNLEKTKRPLCASGAEMSRSNHTEPYRYSKRYEYFPNTPAVLAAKIIDTLLTITVK